MAIDLVGIPRAAPWNDQTGGYQDLYDFTGGADGNFPRGDLTLSGGTLFGMTSLGGVAPGLSGEGTVFALTLPMPTPEPGTLALVGCGAAALASYRWRRSRARRARSLVQAICGS